MKKKLKNQGCFDCWRIKFIWIVAEIEEITKIVKENQMPS